MFFFIAFFFFQYPLSICLRRETTLFILVDLTLYAVKGKEFQSVFFFFLIDTTEKNTNFLSLLFLTDSSGSAM